MIRGMTRSCFIVCAESEGGKLESSDPVAVNPALTRQSNVAGETSVADLANVRLLPGLEWKMR